jgi:hypothetical protein
MSIACPNIDELYPYLSYGKEGRYYQKKEKILKTLVGS